MYISELVLLKFLSSSHYLYTMLLFPLLLLEKYFYKACEFAAIIKPFLFMHFTTLELVSFGDSECCTLHSNPLRWTQLK